MPAPKEIEAAKATLLAEIGNLPMGEVVRAAGYIAERMLRAAEAARA